MKKYASLIFTLFSPHLLWELVLVLQIIMFGVCSVTLISNFVQQQYHYREIGRLFPNESIYFQPYDRLVEIVQDSETTDAVKIDLLANIANYAQSILPESELGTAARAIGFTERGVPLQIIAYNKTMIQQLDIPLSIENSEQHGVGKYIPVLIRGALCNEYGIGDQFEIRFGYNQNIITVCVVGTIADDFDFITPSYGATSPTIDGFFNSDIISDDPETNKNAIVFYYSIDEAQIADLICPAYFVFATDQKIDEGKLLNQTGSIGGYFYKISDMMHNTVEQNVYVNRSALSKVLSSSVFLVVSILGYISLLFIRNGRFLGICIVLGMSRKDMLGSVALPIAVCTFTSIFATLIVGIFCILTNVLSYSRFTFAIILATIAMVVITTVVGTMLGYMIFSRRNAVDDLKGE